MWCAGSVGTCAVAQPRSLNGSRPPREPPSYIRPFTATLPRPRAGWPSPSSWAGPGGLGRIGARGVEEGYIGTFGWGGAALQCVPVGYLALNRERWTKWFSGRATRAAPVMIAALAGARKMGTPPLAHPSPSFDARFLHLSHVRAGRRLLAARDSPSGCAGRVGGPGAPMGRGLDQHGAHGRCSDQPNKAAPAVRLR